MSTTLDTPVVVTETATVQKLDRITIDLGGNQIGFFIQNKDSNGHILEQKAYSTAIWNPEGDTVLLPQAVEDAGKDLFAALVTVAKNQGWMGAGTEVSDL